MQNRATTQEQRITIIERHKAGQDLSSTAESMQLNFYTVRKWWRRYRKSGWAGIADRDSGRPATGPLGSFPSLVKYVVLRLKCEHPGWGLDNLLLHLSRRPSLKGYPLPKRTALYNYLKPYYARFRGQRRQPTGRPVQDIDRAKAVHQRWQMDFKGSIHLPKLGRASSLNVCDEFSSAPLMGEVFVSRKGSPMANLNWRHIQFGLRKCFAKWGMPKQLRMDRDPLFIGSSRFEWPGSLLLWLVGLGIQPIVNPAGRPTHNAQVERLNRTWKEHVGMNLNIETPEQLQLETDQAWEDRRCHLPSRNTNCNNQPPMKALPQLAESRRPFDPKREHKIFRMERVYDYLSQWTWQRSVDSKGRISIGGIQPKISEDHKGQNIKIGFDKKKEIYCL